MFPTLLDRIPERREKGKFVSIKEIKEMGFVKKNRQI
jgi:hypothetical protein